MDTHRLGAGEGQGLFHSHTCNSRTMHQRKRTTIFHVHFFETNMKHIKWTDTNTVLCFATETGSRLIKKCTNKELLEEGNLWDTLTGIFRSFLYKASCWIASSRRSTGSTVAMDPALALGWCYKQEARMHGLRDIQHCSLQVIHLCPPRTLHNSPPSAWSHIHAQAHHATSKVRQKPIPILHWELASKIGS